jgi:hypothetical protein
MSKALSEKEISGGVVHDLPENGTHLCRQSVGEVGGHYAARAKRMDLLDRVGKKGRNKNSPDRMGLFQPQRRKAKTLLLAWLSTSLKAFGTRPLALVR